MTGKELYEFTFDPKYLRGQYAVIFWGPNEATLIKLTHSSTTINTELKYGDRINCQCFDTWLILWTTMTSKTDIGLFQVWKSK